MSPSKRDILLALAALGAAAALPAAAQATHFAENLVPVTVLRGVVD